MEVLLIAVFILVAANETVKRGNGHWKTCGTLTPRGSPDEWRLGKLASE